MCNCLSVRHQLIEYHDRKIFDTKLHGQFVNSVFTLESLSPQWATVLLKQPAHPIQRQQQNMARSTPNTGTGPQVKATAGYGAVVLNCMDKRLVAHIDPMIQEVYGGHGPKGEHAGYYQISLAGAALAARNEVYPYWGTTFRDHVAVVPKLLKSSGKKFGGIIVIDHRNCGAYKLILNKAFDEDLKERRNEPDKLALFNDEHDVHAKVMNELVLELQREFKQDVVPIDLWLMDLPDKKGKVEWKQVAIEDRTGRSLYFETNADNQPRVVSREDMIPLNHGRFTIELWACKPQGGIFEIGRVDLLGKPISDKTSSPPLAFRIDHAAKTGQIKVADPALTITFTPSTKDWAHYAIVYNGEALTLFVDGKKQPVQVGGKSLESVKTPIRLNDHRLRLGVIRKSGLPAVEDSLKGWLDEIRLWNHIRHPDEIVDNKDFELVGKEPGLMIYYKCNQGVANGNNRDEKDLLNLANLASNGQLIGFDSTNSKGNFSNKSAPVKDARDAKLASMALRFNGLENYLVTKNNLGISANQSRTIEFWAKLQSNHGMRYFLTHGTVGQAGGLFGLLHNNGRLHFHGHYMDADTGYDIDLGWHHYALTYDQSTQEMRIYVDGTPTKNPIKKVQLNTTDSPLVIGANTQLAYGTAMNFQGDMAEFRVWRVARSQNKITDRLYSFGLISNVNKNRPSTDEPDLHLYYQMQNQGIAYGDNSSIEYLFDACSAKNDARLNRFTLNQSSSNFVPFGPPRSPHVR